MKFVLFSISLLCLAGTGHAAIHTEEVEYRQGDTLLKGFLAYDDSTRNERPGVLVVHEWWGLNQHAKDRATALAKEGYVAFALDMYGEGKNTPHPKQAGEWSGYVKTHDDIARSRFVAAHGLLKKHPVSRDDQIAAIGYCFGGYIVLSMALQGEDLVGVVSFHGALPTVTVGPEAVKAKILVLHGDADPFIKPEQIQQFRSNLSEAGADWQFVSYGGVKHSFTNPAADKAGVDGLGYDPAADKRSWKAMLNLFDELFSN